MKEEENNREVRGRAEVRGGVREEKGAGSS